MIATLVAFSLESNRSLIHTKLSKSRETQQQAQLQDSEFQSSSEASFCPPSLCAFPHPGFTLTYILTKQGDEGRHAPTNIYFPSNLVEREPTTKF